MVTLFQRKRNGRRGHYYARLIIPADLAPLLQRQEIQRCLETASYQDAHLRGLQWGGYIARLLAYLRRYHHTMNPAQLRSFIQDYISVRLEAWETSWYGGDKPGCETVGTAYDDEGQPIPDHWQECLALLLEGDLQDYAQALRTGTIDLIAPTAKEFLQRYNLSIPEGSLLYRQLCRDLLKAEQRIADTLIKRLQGDYISESLSPIPAVASTKQAQQAGPSILLSQAIKLYAEERERSRAVTSQAASAQALSRFLEIVEDKPLAMIRYEECFQYRETLRKLPTHPAVRYPGKTVAEVLALVENLPTYARISESTLKTTLAHISAFFNWAKKRRRYNGENPITDLLPERVEEEKYEPFSEEDLRLIFGPAFVEQLEKGRLDRYWITLILLHSGMRREEASQLLVSDVKQEGGIWFFDISPDEKADKRLKNKAARRRVPIHSRLQALGFLRYVTEVQTAKQERLFPMLKKGQKTWGDSVGKWFHEHLERVGVRKPEVPSRKVMHSFRSTANGKLTGKVDPDIRRLLTGHTGKDVNAQHYLDPLHIELPKLKAAIECLDFRPFLSALPVYRPTKNKAREKS